MHGWLRRATRLREEPVLKALFEQLGRVRHPQLLHHVGAMCLDGFGADLQLLGSRTVCESVPDMPEHLLFPLRQGHHAAGFRFPEHVFLQVELF
jgi:hypothetical protein